MKFFGEGIKLHAALNAVRRWMKSWVPWKVVADVKPMTLDLRERRLAYPSIYTVGFYDKDFVRALKEENPFEPSSPTKETLTKEDLERGYVAPQFGMFTAVAAAVVRPGLHTTSFVYGLHSGSSMAVYPE